MAVTAPKNARKGDWMQTYTGRQFWPLDARADELAIEDIAHALSMACRYAGHCLQFYSVAEHSVHICRWLRQQGSNTDTQLKGLMHDAPEAYLVDVPRPVKPYLTEYRGIEVALWHVVADWLDLTTIMPGIIKEADDRILFDERHQNMAPCPEPWIIPSVGLGVTLQYWTPAQAKAEFMLEFARLTGGSK
jgi:hypothetical protein